MTDGEKRAYRKALTEQIKNYCHIDYDDDEDVLEVMICAVFEKLNELIPNFDEYALTSRQRMIVMLYIKEMYDNRDVYSKDDKNLSNAAASMLLAEMYRGDKST